MINEERDKKVELDYLRDLGERKIRSLKTAYELTESELVLILRLHRKKQIYGNTIINKLLDK